MMNPKNFHLKMFETADTSKTEHTENINEAPNQEYVVEDTSDMNTMCKREHAQKFPVVESHYCRQSSKKLYLDANLPVAKIHDNLYVEECKSSGKNNATDSKWADKEKSESEDSFLRATFDLQSVLQTPSDDTSQMYYFRKLCFYNLTIYETQGDNHAYCYA
ncbi:hypothetical protein PR048_022245 [Dryococelus australis]|uniref:Uncharacterized protein n=1 Tax=Dryococelus australis TaxID=614101 RepID=A0ABQ9H0H7_9NEOP|nr:hypothetical protein PR048_022245 [Dryococelus australis]